MENRPSRLAEELLEARRQKRAAEAAEIRLLCELADSYRLGSDADAHPALCEQDVPVGGEGVPLVSEFLASELAGLLGCSASRATTLLGQALNLRHRHPTLYAAVMDLEVEAGRAMAAASKCSQLPTLVAEMATMRWIPVQKRFGFTAAMNRLDEIVARLAPEIVAEREAALLENRSVQFGRYRDGSMHLIAQLDVLDAKYLDAAVDQMADLIAEFDAESGASGLPKSVRRAKGLAALAHPAYALALQQRAAQQSPLPDAPGPSDDAARRPGPHNCLGHVCGAITTPLGRLRPKAKVFIHIDANCATASVEQAGVITQRTVARLLGDKKVTVQPVIDLANVPDEDHYRPSGPMTQAIDQIFLTEPFPFSSRSCRSPRIELDHTIAFRASGPPGQTRVGNLAPLGIRVHRAKTAGHWRVDQVKPGRVVWTSPLGYRYQVDRGGTVRL